MLIHLKNGIAQTAAERETGDFDLCTVLLVDDDPIVTEAMKGILEVAVGCKVRVASTAWAALMELADSPIDLVVTDFHMPEINGLRLADLVRRIWPMIPIMMLTGDSSVPLEARSLVDDFLDKG